MESNHFKKLPEDLREKTPEEILKYFVSEYSVKFRKDSSDKNMDRIALASSLGAEDQVLTHILLKINPKARIFILDTRRLHSETYNLMDASKKRYGINYEIFFPESSEIEEIEAIHGPNLFYESAENRKLCCYIRKVKPLRRALSTLDVWITGLRKSQAITRGELKKIEWDESNGLIKLNPLADWSEEQVWKYIRQNSIPYNKLHESGYPSIGCAPCTRAIKPGEDVRAGRWWWESPEHKECGLHVVDEKLFRRK